MRQKANALNGTTVSMSSNTQRAEQNISLMLRNMYFMPSGELINTDHTVHPHRYRVCIERISWQRLDEAEHVPAAGFRRRLTAWRALFRRRRAMPRSAAMLHWRKLITSAENRPGYWYMTPCPPSLYSTNRAPGMCRTR